MRLLGYVRTPTAAHKILDIATRKGIGGAVRVRLGADGLPADLRADGGAPVMLVDAEFTRPDSGRFTHGVLTAAPNAVVMIVGHLTAMAAAQAVAARTAAGRGTCCLFPAAGEDTGFTAAVTAAVGLVASSRRDRTNPGAPAEVQLTNREQQVLTRIAQGSSCDQISRDLVLSRETVKTHIRRLYRKLGATDRGHAVAIAFRSGLMR